MTKNSNEKVPIPGVGAAVIRDGSILLVKRKYHPSKGLWAIPGGKIKWGETLQQAAEREIFEETGIKIKAGRPVYIFDYIKNEGGREFHYIITDLDAEYLSGEAAAGDDAEEVRWAAPADLDNLNTAKATLEFLRHISFI